MNLGHWRDLRMAPWIWFAAAVDAGSSRTTLPSMVPAVGLVLQRAAIASAGGRRPCCWCRCSVAAGSTTLPGNSLVARARLLRSGLVMPGRRLTPPYRPLRLALATDPAALVLAMPLAALEAPSFDPRTGPIKTWRLGTWRCPPTRRRGSSVAVASPETRSRLADRSPPGRASPRSSQMHR
jgi:hypothetical protein